MLQKRDQEMTEFIEKFGITKEEALADQQAAKSTIVGLLEHISSGLESQHHIPDKDRVRVSLVHNSHHRAYNSRDWKSIPLCSSRVLNMGLVLVGR